MAELQMICFDVDVDVDVEVCLGCFLCWHVEFASSQLSFCYSAMPKAPLKGFQITAWSFGDPDGGLKRRCRLFLSCRSSLTAL